MSLGCPDQSLLREVVTLQGSLLQARESPSRGFIALRREVTTPGLLDP